MPANMVRLFLLAIVLVMALSHEAAAQPYSAKHNEISISIDNIFLKETVYFSDDDLVEIASRIPELCLGYKFNFSNGAIRTRTSFSYNDSRYKPNEIITVKLQSLFSLGFNAGYEYHINMNKTQFFAGVEMGVFYVKSKINSMSYYASSTTSELLNVGVAPLAGIKYFISQSLSVSTELRLKFQYYEYGSSQKGYDISAGPLGNISINLMF